MKIEVALLYEDRTWDTEVVDIPKLGGETFEDAVSRWFCTEAVHLTCYRKVVQACVYNTMESTPDDFQQDESSAENWQED